MIAASAIWNSLWENLSIDPVSRQATRNVFLLVRGRPACLPLRICPYYRRLSLRALISWSNNNQVLLAWRWPYGHLQAYLQVHPTWSLNVKTGEFREKEYIRLKQTTIESILRVDHPPVWTVWIFAVFVSAVPTNQQMSVQIREPVTKKPPKNFYHIKAVIVRAAPPPTPTPLPLYVPALKVILQQRIGLCSLN